MPRNFEGPFDQGQDIFELSLRDDIQEEVLVAAVQRFFGFKRSQLVPRDNFWDDEPYASAAPLLGFDIGSHDQGFRSAIFAETNFTMLDSALKSLASNLALDCGTEVAMGADLENGYPGYLVFFPDGRIAEAMDDCPGGFANIIDPEIVRFLPG